MSKNLSSTKSGFSIKGLLPYILPLLALALVIFMFVRWYKARTTEEPVEFLDLESLQAQDLTKEQKESFVKGTTDYNSVKMTAAPDATATGEIRYAIVADKINLSVIANLPASEEEYAVWLRRPGTDLRSRIFNLTEEKAGYIGSISLSTDVLPIDVVVVKASDLLLDEVLLQASLEATPAAFE